jgi:hypothetical protein
MATTTLNLFPARIAFVNADGTLTSEAYRSLQTLMRRVGGPLGDTGIDVFADVSAASTIDTLSTDTVFQWQQDDQMLQDIAQLQPADQLLSDIVQTASEAAAPIEIVTVTASPFTYTAKRPGTLVSGDGAAVLIEFIRAGVTVAFSSMFGEFPMATGDAIRVTYSTVSATYLLAPKIQFIPR